MARVQMYTTVWCGYCDRARELLRARGIEFEEINLDADPSFRERLLDLTGGWTVPQILIDGKPIGGFLELRELDRRGLLTDALAR
ncbi:MAG: glutaredoxin family protein [Gaiellaceae bacterium]